MSIKNCVLRMIGNCKFSVYKIIYSFLKKSEIFRNLADKINKRYLWHWVNIMFNKLDVDRRKQLGPDRTCAEWLLRNGGKVKWIGAEEYLADYNQLPPENTILHIKEVDASGSSIMHYGFPHFEGCKYIDKIILHDCGYLYDDALGMMKPLQKTLTYLQVSKCSSITSKGLILLSNLNNLKMLVIFGMPYLEDKEKILIDLQSNLPNCFIDFK